MRTPMIVRPMRNEATWTLQRKVTRYADFTVTGKPCKEGCDGRVKYRIHLLDKKGGTT